MNHDLIGIKGLLQAQKEQINKIKYMTRMDNERYLIQHPEIEFIMHNFLVKLLEDRPSNPIRFSGEYFNSTDFRSLYEESKKNFKSNS